MQLPLTRRQLMILAGVLAGCVGLGLLVGLLVSLLTGIFAGPRMLNTATVIQRVRSLNHLVTVEYNLEKVVIWEGERKMLSTVVPIPLGQDRIILLAHGTVKAGVDLSRLGPGDIVVRDRSISLNLPPAEITDAYLKENETKVLDRKTGMFTRFETGLEQVARRSAVAAMRDSARSADIKHDSERRASLALTELLKALGFEDVEIKFKSK